MSKKTATKVNIEYATATSPALSETGKSEKERLHLSPAEFGEQIKVLGDEVKNLVKLARKVGQLKSGQHFKVGGEQFGAKELNALVSTHVKTLKQLKKNYTARGKRKSRPTLTKEGKPRKKVDGFGKASFIQQPLIDFFRNANLGVIPGTKRRLQEVFESLLERGVLSRGIMTSLLTIYEFENGLRFEESYVDKDGKTKTRKWFKAGPEMEQHLGPYLAQAEADDKAKSDADMVDSRGNVKPRFNRNKFLYNRLQSIMNPGIVEKEQLESLEDSEARFAYLADPEIAKELAEVKAVVSTARAASRE
jgi:hypothetical protein